MQDNASSHARRDPRIQRLLDSFAVEPTDLVAFRSLEEHLSLAGDWRALAGVYECRLAALGEKDGDRVPVLLRLANVLATRLQDPSAARSRFEEVLRSAPRQPQALAGLRRIRIAAGDLAAALQIAELEEAIDLPRPARAALLAETATLWEQLGEAGEQRKRIRESLRLDPGCDAALAQAARISAAEGRTKSAIELLERRLARASGPARADTLAELSALYAPTDSERARRLLREALRDAPLRRSLLERAIELEQAAGAVDRVVALEEELWKTLSGPEEQLRFALTVATRHLEDRGSAEAALVWVDRAVSIAPPQGRVHELRARILRRLNRIPELIEALERCAQLEEPSAMRLLELGVLLERSERLEAAVEQLQQALALSSEDDEILAALDRSLARLGRFGERIEILDRRIALAHEPTRAAGLRIDQGDLFESGLGDSSAAEHAYREALRLDPGHPMATERLRELFAKHDRTADLVELLSARMGETASATIRAGLQREIGEIQLDRMQRPDEARLSFLRALEIDPLSREALEGLHRSARASGDPARILEACERELQQGPDTVRSIELLREILDASRRAGDWLRARRAAETWAELDPGHEPLLALARVGRDLHDPSCEGAALERLEGRLASDPAQRAAVLRRMGDLALEQADPNALAIAAEHYRQALAIVPDPELRTHLIDLYRRSGRHEELAFELRGLLASAAPEEESRIRLELARALVDSGEMGEAVAALRPAFDADPGHDPIAELLEALLAEQGQLEELVPVLARRLSLERALSRRRELAHRLAGVLLDGLDRAADAVAILRELADPSRHGRLEDLFGRALESSGRTKELEAWLRARIPHLDGDAQAAAWLQLGCIEESHGRIAEAISTLRRAQRVASHDRLPELRTTLLRLVRAHGSPEERMEIFDSLLEEIRDPSARAALHAERAHLWAGALDTPVEALADLARARRLEPLAPEDLRLFAHLAEQLGNLDARLEALEALCEATTDESERIGTLLEIAAIRADGPPSVRDSEAAYTALQRVLGLDPAHAEAFDRLDAWLSSGAPAQQRCACLEQRLAVDALRSGERERLTHRLAALLLAAGTLEQAADVLRRERTRCPQSEELDELWFTTLGRLDRTEEQIQLCSERARATAGAARAHWARRWLDALETRGEPMPARLEAIEIGLEGSPRDPHLVSTRLRILRNLGDPERLAAGLDAAIEVEDDRAPARLRLLVELLDLLEGPLARPADALARLDRETRADPGIAARAARLAARAGDSTREARWLRELLAMSPPGESTPDRVRRLGLALCASGETTEAEPHLWHALSRDPADRELAETLESLLRARNDASGLLRLFETHFGVAPGERRAVIARDAFALANEAGTSADALRWVRRLHALQESPVDVLERWLELERAEGTLPGTLQAIRALRERTTDEDRIASLLAAEARIEHADGHLELARTALTEALRRASAPETEWLTRLDKILVHLGEAEERLDVLRALAAHPDATPEMQRGALDERIEILASRADRRGEAAAQLRALVDDPAAREHISSLVPRLRRLLGLYDALGHHRDWCEIAQRLAAHADTEDAIDLHREIARRLEGPIGAVDLAIDAWERILGEIPADSEALEKLAVLLRQPGNEARLADVLDRRASVEPHAAAALSTEAAAIRWRALGHADGALRGIERALDVDPDFEPAHELRAEIGARLGRTQDEIASLRALLARDPEGPLAADRWLRLARLAIAQQTEDPQLARTAALRAHALGFSDETKRRKLRRLLERTREWSAALEMLREELAAAPYDESPALLAHIAHLAWDELHDAAIASDALDALLESGAAVDAADHQRHCDALAAQERWPESLAARRRSLETSPGPSQPEAWLDLARLELEHAPSPHGALDACQHALHVRPQMPAALALRARVYERLGDFARAVDDRSRQAAATQDDSEAASAFCTAAEMARTRLGDVERAWALYRQALRRDSSQLAALLGAGEIAHSRGEWADAERWLGLACTLLPGSPEEDRLAATALRAGEAASAQRRHPEALRYFELALERDPSHPEALDAMGQLALRLRAYDRARPCLEKLLALEPAAEDLRAERLVRLAQACEGSGDPGRAIDVLREVIDLRPGDEVSRARLVDLLEREGRTEEAVSEIDRWSALVSEDFRLRLDLRAAAMERTTGSRDHARRRLHRIVSSEGAPASAWEQLATLTLDDEGPEAALEVTSRALTRVEDRDPRGALLWIESRALDRLGRSQPAAVRACEALELRPQNLEAAMLLAQRMGLVGSWKRAVAVLERALDATKPPPETAAEIWEVIGRAYAGPLEDLERAQRSYRRALECNELRSSAREALADITAFDPASHRESVALHRALLQRHPARAGSWRAIARMAEHWQRVLPLRTANAVMSALALAPGEGSDGPPAPVAIDAGPCPDPRVEAAIQVLCAVDGGAPLEQSADPLLQGLPREIQEEVHRLGGWAWSLPDESLREAWSQPLEEDEDTLGDLLRRARRRVMRARREARLDDPGDLDPRTWRAHVLARAAARAVHDQRLPVRSALLAMLRSWPETQRAATSTAIELGAAIQACPPARILLGRLADASLRGLGLGR